MPLTINNNNKCIFKDTPVSKLLPGWWLESDGSVWLVDGSECFCFNNTDGSYDGKKFLINIGSYIGSFRKIEEPNITIDIR